MLKRLALGVALLIVATWPEACNAAGSQPARAKRVVLMPNPLTSHTKYHTNVARALHKRGHDVFVLMPNYLVQKGQLDTTNFTVIEYNATINVEEAAMNDSRGSYFRGENENFALQIGIIRKYCDDMLRNETLFRQIRDLKPDLVVIDNLPQTKMLAVLPYKIGVPFAYVGSVYQPLDQRIPFSPAFNPVPIWIVTDHMTFFQRVITTLITIAWSLMDPFIYTDAVARYAPERPYISADMLIAHAEIWLVEMDHILDYPRPTLPNVKLIGGTATGPSRPLSSKLKEFVESAANGVILVSFGSYVLNVPKEISDKLWEVFAQLPYKVIFRSNLTSQMPSKVYVSSWIPQNDILGHDNVKAFVSHCGKNGQYEALYHAVPVVGVPIFGDQPYNAERMRVKGFAEVLDLRSSTVEEMVATIMQVAGDPSYKESISAASRLFRQEYHVPMDEAAFWLDHVMIYGGAYMRSSGHDMPLYQFMLIDVIAFLVACFFTSLALIIGSLYIIFRLLCTRKRRDTVLLLVMDEKTLFDGKKQVTKVCRKAIRAGKKSFLAVSKLLPLHRCSHDHRDRRYFTKKLECA
ncbi:UDP-glucuronosyltransferase 2C1-like [Littorina saxatilis]|uniref:UDP-glycosyltransferases domain-containing protein n=1 Tax=Littorina saxatilis TaxID=31220 RepID=A0AAN9BTM7_9CAEN